MALDIEAVYSVGRACRRLEAAAYGATLTNNPAPGIEAAYTAEAEAMGVLLGGGLEPGAAPVFDNEQVNVSNSADVSVGGTHRAVVVDGTLDHVRLSSTIAPVANSQAITMQNSAGTAIAGTHTATVAAGVVSNVRLAATVATVVSGSKINAGSVTGIGAFATITVANGVITGIALSAS